LLPFAFASHCWVIRFGPGYSARAGAVGREWWKDNFGRCLGRDNGDGTKGCDTEETSVLEYNYN